MKLLSIVASVLVLVSCNQNSQTTIEETKEEATVSQKPDLADSSESHLLNLHQLTYGGDNAEAYFSFNNRKLVFQSNNKAWGVNCDQIFTFSMPA
jgi:Tfp pilus assembly protein PilP